MYDMDTVYKLGANRRIHVRDGMAFAYGRELDLVVRVNESDPRYFAPKYDWEAVRHATQSVNDAYAAQAKALLAEAQAWVDDPNSNNAKFSASNLLRYAAPLGLDGQREWRPPYDVLYRDGDMSFQWPSSNGTAYALIVRNGHVVAVYRDPTLNEGRWE